MTSTASKRTHVFLPGDVVEEIDRLVGKRGRSAFLTEIAREELQRRRQREALHGAAGSWKDEDHPELKDGAAEWVRRLRAESEERFARIRKSRGRG